MKKIKASDLWVASIVIAITLGVANITQSTFDDWIKFFIVYLVAFMVMCILFNEDESDA